jgi:hypothetical protein
MKSCVAAGLVLALAVAGCTGPWFGKSTRSPSLTPPKPVDRVDAIDLWAVPPAAVNWDDDPAPDGIIAQIFLYQADQPEPVLVKGTLNFLLFEGRVPRAGLATAKPQRIWSYGPTELATRQIRGLVGWGYTAQLGWGRPAPASPAVTFAVRYDPVAGPPLYSAPIVIQMPSQVRTGPVSSTLGEPVKPREIKMTHTKRYTLKFRHETIDPAPPGSQHNITLLADVNKDGRLDVIIGSKGGNFNLGWYENPSWRRHDMAQAPDLEAGGVVIDVNGDGRPDVVAGQQAGGRELYWFECPPDPTAPWTRHLIDNQFQQYYDQAVGDVDGDGKPEIVILSPQSGVLAYYKIPAEPKVEPWPKECCHVIATGLQDVEGLVVVDIDGDRKVEMIAGTTIYKRTSSGEWQGEAFAKGYQGCRLTVADLDGDNRLEIILAEGKSDRGRLVWFKGPSWTAHRLCADLFHPHSLAVADFNGDGLPDIFVGEMGPGENKNPRLLVYVNLGAGRFEANLISEGIPTHEAKVGDLRGDGRPSIVGKAYGPEKHVDLWVNETGLPAPPNP